MFPPLRSCEKDCPQAARLSPEEAAEATVACMRYGLKEEDFCQQVERYAQGAELLTEETPEELRSPKERLFCRA